MKILSLLEILKKNNKFSKSKIHISPKLSLDFEEGVIRFWDKVGIGSYESIVFDSFLSEKNNINIKNRKIIKYIFE